MPAVRELESKRQNGRAQVLLRKILIDAPRCPEAHRALARHLVQSNHAAAAGDHLEIAAETAGLTPDLALQIAVTLRAQAKIPEAITAATTAYMLNADNLHSYVALAVALEADGKLEEAAAIVAESDKRFGEKAPAMRRTAAMIFAAQKDFTRALARLEAADLAPFELFERGLLREKTHAYELAWNDWMTAKAMQRAEGCIYPATAVAAHFADLFEMASRPRTDYYLPREPRADAARLSPLFITGFPRSGTTMIEAALSSHPAIIAGDELAFLPDLIDRAPTWLNVREPYPRALMAAAMPENRAVPAMMSQWYCDQAWRKIGLADFSKTAGFRSLRYFTDKMPSNEMHVPFIRMLFPRSPIVNVRRHPLDTLVSNMSHWLIHGRFNACALESCATHYALVDSLVCHYRDKLPASRLHEIRYESFVADHRAAIDAALAAAELGPNAQCYDFHLNPWHSRTISHRQIKEPVHDKSVGRFRPFLDFLRPIVPTIAPILEREGYSL